MSFQFAAFTVSMLNAGFPEMAKLLTYKESHAFEIQRQTSMYFKIATFRWVNTAIVITLLTPFTLNISAASDGLIYKVFALFLADIVATNGFYLTDPMGHFNRHILAPRAKTQDAMKMHFQGEIVELAER